MYFYYNTLSLKLKLGRGDNMAASYDYIKGCLKNGEGKGYSHMLMVCDTFDYEDYPVFVSEGEDVNAYISKYQDYQKMSKVMEVYSYALDLDAQLKERRAWHLEFPKKVVIEANCGDDWFDMSHYTEPAKAAVRERKTSEKSKPVEQPRDGIIDLHIHTKYSDGDYTPLELTPMIKEAGIHTFSITDHDHLGGSKELDTFNDPELTYIPGVECSAHTDYGRMHILGYGIDVHNEGLSNLLEKKQYRSYAFVDIIRGMLQKDYGIRIPNEDFDELYSKEGDIGRPQLALMLLKHGYVETIDEAFEKYLNDAQQKAKKMITNPSEEEVIAALKGAKGVISLAHPVSLKLEYEDLKKRLLKLKALGLEAIEIQHIHQNAAYRQMLYALADELVLLESGGTDFHGPSIKPDVRLGTGERNNIYIKDLSLLNHSSINRLL